MSKNETAIDDFTTEELDEKEQELLRLFKKTTQKYHNAIRMQWLSCGNLWPIGSSNIKNKINYKHRIITVSSDDRTGTIAIWGKQDKYNLSIGSRNIKIIFPLDDDKLTVQVEAFMEYPITGHSLITEIFRRLDIKTKKDYELLKSGFESLLISYL